MKAMEFLTLLGELEEGDLVNAAPAVTRRSKQKKKRRALWTAAACACICVLGFSAWFFLPPGGTFGQAQRTTILRVEDQLLVYEIIKTETLSPYERLRLPHEPGEILGDHGDSRFYRGAGEEDLLYILQIDGEGRQTVLRFCDYVSTAERDVRKSEWYAMGWLDDDDIAALEDGGDTTLGGILQTVYGLASAEDIRSISFSKHDGYGDDVSRGVKVKTVKVTDREDIGRLYRLLAAMSRAGLGETPDGAYVGPRDEAYLNGDAPLSAQVDRRITVKLKSGRELELYYDPAAGLWRMDSPDCFIALEEADNQWLIGLSGIDMEWRDWGTEKAPDHGGEGDETATAATAATAPAADDGK